MYNQLPVKTHGRLSTSCIIYLGNDAILLAPSLPRAQADGKGQAVEEKARVEKRGSENSARREPNRSTRSLGQSLLDLCDMLVDLRILAEVAGLTGPTISTKIPKL